MKTSDKLAKRYSYGIAPIALAMAMALATPYLARADFREERQARAYQAAMADYSAGRMKEACAGFEKAVADDGDNSSARFQYACLLHDYSHDYMGAICNYREYLRLEPKSDKAPLARERIMLCEMELARELAAKHNLVGNEKLAEESRKAREELKDAEKEMAKLAKDLEEAERTANTLKRENERLRRMVASIATDDDAKTAPTGVITDDAKLLDQDDGETAPRRMTGLAEAKIEDDSPSPKNRLDEAKAILADSEDDSSDAPPDLLDPAAPPQPEGKRLIDFASGEQKDSSPSRPKTYKVEEGDTLYKIALKFYGKTSAWKMIRDANKATISTDGRVNTGQTIILP